MTGVIRNMVRVSATIALAMMTIWSSAAAQDGDAILARVDSVMNAPRDMTALQRMWLIEADGSRRERTLRVFQLGAERRLVRFLTPADVRGVGFLRVGPERMYLYLPAFRRVRRIASSIKNDRFMGTDFSYEDVAQTRYAGDYLVDSVDSAEVGYRLVLLPRPGADVSYARLEMEVDRANWMVRRVDYYSADGKRVKMLTASQIEQLGEYWYARRIEMVSLASGHRTVLELGEVEFDTGLSRELFSERALKRPI